MANNSSKIGVNSKEFTTIVKAAKVELKTTFSNPYVVVNMLNKAAKGDYSKIENCSNLSRENIAKVAKVLKSMHNERYAFDLRFLCSRGVYFRDSKGRVCVKKESKTIPAWGVDICDISESGYTYFAPVANSARSIFNAFAKVAKVAIVENEKAEKESVKAAKKTEKEYNSAKKCIMQDFNAGKFNEFELANKLNELKAKYNK